MRQIPFLCLANSAREGGHCVAGIDLETHQWIRPVGRVGGRLSYHDVTIEGTRNQIRPFDTVLLTVGEATPEIGQPENSPSVIDIRMFRPLPAAMRQPRIDLKKFLHSGPSLFEMTGVKNDRVSHAQLKRNGPTNSLALLLLEDPEFLSEPGGRSRIKIPYGSKVHSLIVTDPTFRDREKRRGPWVVCVSLGSVFKDHHYGLVAMAVPLAEVPEKYSLANRNKPSSLAESASALRGVLREWRTKKVRGT